MRSAARRHYGFGPARERQEQDAPPVRTPDDQLRDAVRVLVLPVPAPAMISRPEELVRKLGAVVFGGRQLARIEHTEVFGSIQH